ncbi:MAG TPA: PA14 domain-containing protein [Dongiaceae bacterium]|nr:PA14 domain-containing protein [Dongiaceae bacterium]
MLSTSRIRATVVGLAAAVALVVALAARAETVTGAMPVEPQPSAEQVAPGLAVTYFFRMFSDVNDVADADEGVAGEPLALLDARPPRNGDVLTSGKAMGVGAQIRGLIDLATPGTYVFRVNSNDGVKLWIGDKLLHEDPFIHPDKMSPPLEFAVEQAGWHALAIDYYQRKGTATLQLLWTPPGGAESIVPAEAYAYPK